MSFVSFSLFKRLTADVSEESTINSFSTVHDSSSARKNDSCIRSVQSMRTSCKVAMVPTGTFPSSVPWNRLFSIHKPEKDYEG